MCYIYSQGYFVACIWLSSTERRPGTRRAVGMWSWAELQNASQEGTHPFPNFRKERGSDFFNIYFSFFFSVIELKREKNPHPILYFAVRKLSICTAWELIKELRNTNENACQFVGSESNVGSHWGSVWAWEAGFVGSIGEGSVPEGQLLQCLPGFGGKGQSPERHQEHPAMGGAGGAERAEKHSANELGVC